MRKNQKYSKEFMYSAIRRWKVSGLSQVKFCSGENLSVKTFNYWLRKYRGEKFAMGKPKSTSSDTFIPVEVSDTGRSKCSTHDSGRIELLFPNGVRLSCQAGIEIVHLKSLINL